MRTALTFVDVFVFRPNARACCRALRYGLQLMRDRDRMVLRPLTYSHVLPCLQAAAAEQFDAILNEPSSREATS